ncbi:EXS-domain-containing protein [Hypoxylon trugodes]|uniref:EXS-domain-containing protein n=1 Tax=Hypoxylon trugodes TaxID=326681 RepID=UPI00218FA5E7|nr:EXS-domain-containing protein [Hypoxylon trugodes]KAI1394154.1 EXS-domain-containing protein [Hypoxylon trugodes]
MDGDLAVEPELDSFSLTFPLPYRVAFIIVLAVWAWGANLHYLYTVGIDVPSLIRYPGRSSPHHPTHHLSTYRLATVLSSIFIFALLVFWAFTHRDPDLVLRWDWLPLLYLAILLGLLIFIPALKSLSHSGRARLRSTLRRISVGGIAETKDGKFGDILLADVLTSYAKVLADLYVALCMFIRGGERGGATARPDRGCGGAVVVPLILAIPSLVRLRQCLIEYGRVRRGRITENTGWGGQHLANALKYATAFPVIVFSAMQRNSTGGQPPPPHYYQAWIGACAVNSLYSFYWDVAKDWDLTLFDSKARSAHDLKAFGLRRRLHVGPPVLYYAVIALDLLLRCTWSLKLSPHLGRIADWEGSIFIIELLEVFRRWVWIFFRVETEWIRNTNVPGLEADDILLPDYHNHNIQGPKYEDDD